MGEGIEFLPPKIKPGEAFRSKLPRDDGEGGEKKRPDFHIVSAHGRNVSPGLETRGDDTARKVEYVVGGATHVLPESILQDALKRMEYKKKRPGKSRSGDGGFLGGANSVEVGEKEGNKMFGRGLLNKLNRVDISFIEVEGYSEDQNLALRVDFAMKRQHLKELVLAYERKLARKQNASRDMQEIVAFAKTILDTFSFGEDGDVSDGLESKKRGRKTGQKKMRLSDTEDAGEKTTTKKSTPKRGHVPKSDRAVVDDAEAPVVESSVMPEKTFNENGIENGNGDLVADFRYLLADGVASIDAKILGAKNREDISFIPSRSLPDGTKIFIEMTEENRLKKIYKQLIEQAKKSEAFKLKQEWIAENHRLEMSYLKQSLIVEILAVGADTMERIDKAPNSKAMQSIGRIVRTKDSEDRVFIPTDSGSSRNDPSGTEGIRVAIQNMIDAWRGERVPKQGKWKNFEDYFQREFSPLIADSNKQIQKFWEEKRSTFSKESRKEKSNSARRTKKEKPVSMDLVDSVALERSALQSAERYFVDRAIPAIEETLRDAGVDLIWLLSDGEYNKSVLDFVLQEVGVNIVDIAAGYTGQLPSDERSAFEQKIRAAAKELLVERVMEKISRMVELKAPEEMGG